MKPGLYILIAICWLCTATTQAQDIPPVDSIRTDTIAIDTTIILETDSAIASVKSVAGVDTAAKKKLPFEPNAKKAGMYSSILPGLGQAYNRQYWKIPLVYAVLGTAGYFIGFNYTKYKTYRQAYIYAIDGDPATVGEFPLQDAADLQRLQNDYKKDLDVIVLLTSVGYALQIMDAVASAHLKNFDISRDISMQMKPMVQSNFIGVALVMNFK